MHTHPCPLLSSELWDVDGHTRTVLPLGHGHPHQDCPSMFHQCHSEDVPAGGPFTEQLGCAASLGESSCAWLATGPMEQQCGPGVGVALPSLIPGLPPPTSATVLAVFPSALLLSRCPPLVISSGRSVPRKVFTQFKKLFCSILCSSEDNSPKSNKS